MGQAPVCAARRLRRKPGGQLISISGPPDPAFALSASRIDEGALLPDESWFASAIAWARRSAGRPLGGTASTSLIEACGKPPFFLDSIRPGLHPDRLDTFADLFDWLALKKFQGAMVHDTGTIELMAQHNMRLFRSFSATMKLVANQLFPDPATRRKAAEAFPWFAAFTAIDSYLATVDGTSAQREVKQNVTSYRRILLWWTIATTLLVVCAVGAGLAVGFIDGTALGRFFGSVLPR